MLSRLFPSLIVGAFVLQGIQPSAALPAQASAPSCGTLATGADLRFAVIGDYGLEGQPESDVAARVATWSPDLVLTVGDDNYPSGSSATIDANIGQYYSSFICPYTGAYGAGASVNRFFPALGNHDWVAANAQPYLDYFTLPGNERYYDFVQGPVHFFVLDSDPNEPDGIGAASAQAAWLQAALGASTSAWDIVLLHHAPYSSSSLHGSSTTLQWPYEQWGADAVIAGHDHTYERLTVGGIPYFVNGLGGYTTKYNFGTPLAGSQLRYNADYGAMLVDASSSEIQFNFISRTGATIDTFAMQKPLAPLDLPELDFQLVASGLTLPDLVTHAGDGSGRLFILEKVGRIRIFKDGALLPTPFLDITGLVPNPLGNEQGLLSLAFDPAYSSNRRFYVLYNATDGDLKLARYLASVGDPDIAEASATILKTIEHSDHSNHNGGTLEFGPDGFLYWSVGDGGGGGDPGENAQDTGKLLGKILRLDVNAAAPGYFAAGNPFIETPTDEPATLGEIWAYGLRNPWRTAFDSLTGDLFIADVGQNEWEEIDFQPAASTGGENYGWDEYEAHAPYESPSGTLGKVFPVAEYDHNAGCSVTGGHVYRGSHFPALEGVYLYGDYCSGQMWGLVHNLDDSWTSSLIASTGFSISSFGQDESGEIYVVDYGGEVYHIRATPWIISGNVRLGGVALSYTDITAESVVSAADGSYSLPVSNDWTGTVTPSKAGCSFSPPSKSYGPVTADISGENYDATCTLTYKSVGTQDGWMLESSENSGVGGSLDAVSNDFKLGDDASNRQYRAILSFNTATLPDSAVLTGATLQIRKTGSAGVNPFSSLGNIVVDIKQGGFSNNASLQLSDFSAMGTKHFVFQITNTPVGGWYSRVFPTGTLGYINLAGGTQFRLRFATDDNNNLAANLLKFASGNVMTTDRPQLIISFHAP